MSKFVIEPHFRLQEWVAEEKGYFRAEGLDYEFRELIRSTAGQHHNKVNEGAFQSIEKGREADVSCACHWTVNVAASNGHAKLYADVYSVAPSGIFVAADSPIRTPRRSCGRADLGRLSIGKPLLDHPGAGAVHGGRRDQPDVRGRHAVSPDGAVDRGQEPGGGAVQRALLSRRATGLPQGDRHHLHDCGHDQGRRPIPKTSSATSARLRRAQRDIDLRPELYTHYYKNEFPERFHAVMDTRRWGPGERIVFETYSKEVFEQSFDWIARARDLCGRDEWDPGEYDRSTISFAAE